MLPVNRRLFGAARMTAPGGIRVDDRRRVWTGEGEGEGVVVRSVDGRVIGIFNVQYFTRDVVNLVIAQMELAGDKLKIYSVNNLWVVQLAEALVAA